MGQYRVFARQAPISAIDNELAEQHIAVHAGTSERGRRQLLRNSVDGIPANSLIPGTPHANTLTWTPGPTPLIAEYVLKSLTTFFTVQLVIDLLAIVMLVLDVTDTVDSNTAAQWLTWLIAASIAEAALGLIAMFLPNRWLRMDPHASRILIALTVIGGALGALALVFLWGVDIHRIAILSILWFTVLVITVADLVGLNVVIKRD